MELVFLYLPPLLSITVQIRLQSFFSLLSTLQIPNCQNLKKYLREREREREREKKREGKTDKDRERGTGKKELDIFMNVMFQLKTEKRLVCETIFFLSSNFPFLLFSQVFQIFFAFCFSISSTATGGANNGSSAANRTLV